MKLASPEATVKMIVPPSGISGRALCAVNSRPLTLVPTTRSTCSSVIEPNGTRSTTAALAKMMSTRPCSRPICP
jgi:hypothetical protein